MHPTHRWPTHPRVELVSLLALAWAIALTSVGCETGHEFVCGSRIRGTEDVRVCDRRLEVCICATGGCAVPDESCPSHLRYVDPPFSGEVLEARCVYAREAATTLDQSGASLLCDESATDDGGTTDGAVSTSDASTSDASTSDASTNDASTNDASTPTDGAASLTDDGGAS